MANLLGKAAGEMTGPIKPPKPAVSSAATPQVRSTGGADRGPGAIKAAPPTRSVGPVGSMNNTPIRSMPQLPSLSSTGGRAGRLANAQALYGAGGTGWNAAMGGPPSTRPADIAPGPPQPADPYEFGQATPGQGVLGSEQMPATGGGFQAPPQPGLPPDFMQRIQQLMQTNPQMLMQLLGPIMGGAPQGF